MTLDGVIDRIRCPLLVVHGVGDRQVPLEQAQKMGKGYSIIASKVRPLTSMYRSDIEVQIKPFKERIRSAGQRSFVRSAGV